MTLELALDRELSNILLLNELRVGLDLASFWELFRSSANSCDFDTFEEGVAGAVVIDSRELH